MTVSRPKLHYAWIVLAAMAVITIGTSGLRSMFGVFIKPMEAEFGWDRAALSGAAAVSWFLLGAVSPFFGWLADRWSARRVILLSCSVLAVGTVLTSGVTSLWHLYVTSGVLMAAGAGGASLPAMSALAARWFESRRGLVLGLLGGAMSAGQLVVVPLAMWLTVHGGWRQTFLWLGVALFVVTVPLGVALIWDDPAQRGLRAYGARTGPATSHASAPAGERRVSVAEAMQVPAFWLLAITFFVCGYTTGGLVLTHLVPHAAEHGFTEMQAAQALGVMGAMNMVGTVLSGWICDRWGRKGPLAFYYGFRGLTLLALPAVWSLPTLHLFAAVFGLNFISTVPPTTALTANIFGRLSVGTLSGWILFAHQAGAAMGAALGGWMFDLTGSYNWVFVSGALLAFVASALSLAIKEEPVNRTPRRQPAPSPLPQPAV